jgi:hypothetical protein
MTRCGSNADSCSKLSVSMLYQLEQSETKYKVRVVAAQVPEPHAGKCP